MTLRDWRELLRLAEIETEIPKLQALVLGVEEAIYLRSQELNSLPDSFAEREEISQALDTLLKIKIEKLNYPPLKK